EEGRCGATRLDGEKGEAEPQDQGGRRPEQSLAREESGRKDLENKGLGGGELLGRWERGTPADPGEMESLSVNSRDRDESAMALHWSLSCSYRGKGRGEAGRRVSSVKSESVCPQ
ncbi:hypothetical protein H1C71_041954, partial [Ictidomys tridecemlineatus]